MVKLTNLKQLLTASKDGSIKLWDALTLKLLKVVCRKQSPIDHISSLHNSGLLLSVHNKGLCCVWNLRSGMIVRKNNPFNRQVMGIDRLAKDNLFIFSLDNGEIVILNILSLSSVQFIDHNTVDCIK